MSNLTPEHRDELRRALHYSGQPSFTVERDTLKTLLDAADELDHIQQEKRAEQVKRIKAEHLRLRVQGKSYCAVDGMGWPCLSIRNLEQPSEEIVPSPPCPLPVGDRPYWMSADQWDPCACILLKDHDGPCECSHTEKGNRWTSPPIHLVK